MKYFNFFIKLFSAAVIALCLLFYQNVSARRLEDVRINEERIAEAEEHNKEIERIEKEILMAAEAETLEEETERGPFPDGEFSGNAQGYGGNIGVIVTVEGGFIKKIEVTDHSLEDPAYYMLAEAVTEKIIEKQSTDVDTVTGATLSSGGIIEAIADALGEPHGGGSE